MNPQDPHNMRILNHTNGVENEHFAVFEQVNATSGALLKDKVTLGLATMEAAATRDNRCDMWGTCTARPAFALSAILIPYMWSM